MTKPYHKHIRKKILSFLLLGTLLSLPVLFVYLFIYFSYFGPINDGFPCVFTQLSILYNFSVFLRTFTDPRASCLSFFLSQSLSQAIRQDPSHSLWQSPRAFLLTCLHQSYITTCLRHHLPNPPHRLLNDPFYLPLNGFPWRVMKVTL